MFFDLLIMFVIMFGVPGVVGLVLLLDEPYEE
jgi:hypothetical protein